MRMIDIIESKIKKQVLSEAQIQFAVRGYTSGEIPDYQMSALLTAIFLNGMQESELMHLTLAMAYSGDIIDLSPIAGIKVDKHSTGGVGDKTTLIAGPIAAACGVPVAKISGRGLGHTGGTVDKLESIPGYRTSLPRQDFIRQTKEIGISLIGQTGNLAPADKKIYALRDATATVQSLPLIASSIMSKKIAAGADAILLDVKTGSGALLAELEDSIALAQEMIRIGSAVKRETRALVTNMNIPLGNAIGNSLEVIESIAVLQGSGPKALTELCLLLASEMLVLAGKGDPEECRRQAEHALASGQAYERLIQLVEAQSGEAEYIRNPSLFKHAGIIKPFTAAQSGYLASIDTKACGLASVVLGAGRNRKEDRIDYSAGIVLKKQYGDPVRQGETIAELHTASQQRCEDAAAILEKAFQISDTAPAPQPLLLAVVTKDGIQRF